MKSYSVLFDKNYGSLGNVTATQSPDGATILKSKIQQMTNPNTAGQQAQRTVFRDMQIVASNCISQIREYFKKSKPQFSAYNSFMQKAILAANTLATYSLLSAVKIVEFSRGNLYKVIIDPSAGLSYDAQNETLDLDLEWDYDANATNQVGTDKLVLHSYSIVSGNSRTVITAHARSAGSASVSISCDAGEDCVVSAFFISADGTDQMTSSPLAWKKADNTVVAI